MVPKMYRKRSETLQKQLFEARSATAEANEGSAVVEERLSKLESRSTPSASRPNTKV